MVFALLFVKKQQYSFAVKLLYTSPVTLPFILQKVRGRAVIILLVQLPVEF